jgi:hypothetical protein
MRSCTGEREESRGGGEGGSVWCIVPAGVHSVCGVHSTPCVQVHGMCSTSCVRVCSVWYVKQEKSVKLPETRKVSARTRYLHYCHEAVLTPHPRHTRRPIFRVL